MVKNIAGFDHGIVNREFMVNMIRGSLWWTISDPESVSLKAEPHYMNSDDCGLGTIEDLDYQNVANGRVKGAAWQRFDY